ncbi:MAG: DUF4252 domain-containing protein [Thermoanaerobaculia bacterium]|nr:DUF4252 domain-containing protein [Thermoanaerobaculia bacterium]
MRKYAFFLLTIFLALPASAQRINIDIPGLAERAAEVIDVTLDAQMLRVASKFFSSRDSDRAVREMVNGLEGIYVRSYEFDKVGEYDRAIVDRLRSQLGAEWKKIVNVRSRDRENVEVFLHMRGDAVRGLFVISAEPRELTIVNIVGPIDIDKLGSLEGQFGIPKMSMEKGKQ